MYEIVKTSYEELLLVVLMLMLIMKFIVKRKRRAERDEVLQELRGQLSDKDERLKAAELCKKHICCILQFQVNQLKQLAAERDSQRVDAKTKLADKQADVEKLKWEARTSNKKVRSLQEELDSMRLQISSLMQIFDGLFKDDSITPTEDYDITPYYLAHLTDSDDMDEIEMQHMEEAAEAYVAAVAMVKEKQDEESLLAAARARLVLKSFVFKNKTNAEF